ncbi:MAG: glycoside hydrolase family 97 C-terminal domain-containing protein, partial [Calditrichaeota bacterium]|nr:glycoside hydrolase family 97 C-terminal domain-containing protein [Calditrichota bacterium]
IGEYITTVRKDRHGPDWYLGSLTNEEARSFEINLSFLDGQGEYLAHIYADAPGITWQNGGEKIAVSRRIVSAADTLILQLAPGGGTAVRFEKQ